MATEQSRLLDCSSSTDDGTIEAGRDDVTSSSAGQKYSARRAPLRGSVIDSVRSSVRSGVHSLVRSSFVLDGDACSVRDLGGEASITSEVFNMSKNLVGSGVLSLSGGIAIYSNSPWACLSSVFWVVVAGIIFAYYCILIAKVCRITKSATYRECWEETMGERGTLIVSLVNAFKPAIGNLAYATILSQTFSSLLQTLGYNVNRIESLLLITTLILLPLSLMKNLHVLAPFSILGTASIILTAVAMSVRYFDGSYLPGGRFHRDIPADLRPDFGTRDNPWTPQVLPYVNMAFEAYVMHYNSPRFFVELYRPTIPRFTAAVSGGFGLSAAIYAAISVFGFLTFGGHSNGYILNNYSPHDPLATVCRVLIALSMVTVYPVVFIGFRDGMLDVLDVPPERQTSNNLNMLTVVLVAIITLIAAFCQDLGMINAIGGGTLGTVIVFLFPSLMYHRAVNFVLKDRATQGQRREAVFALILMCVGMIVGAIGVVVSLQGM